MSRPETHTLVQVAVDAAVTGLYTYLEPPELAGEIAVGQALRVPLGRRSVSGYALALKEVPGSPDARYRPVEEILRPEPLFGPSLTKLINFTSHYYFYPPGLCAKEILPGGLSPELEKMVCLKAQADQALLGAEAELSQRLAQAGGDGLSVRALEKEGFGPSLKKLAAEGRLTFTYALAAGAVKAAFEWWLEPAPNPPQTPPRLGPKERRLWELTSAGPAKPLSYYGAYLKNPLPQARSLAAKGLAVLSRREIWRDDPHRALEPLSGQIPEPTAQQARALAEILPAIESGSAPRSFLLFGVTGSGKTEVYLRAAAAALRQGRQVLWLAPEIGLTLGLEGLLKGRLGADKVAVLHSALSAGQRHDQWLRIRRGLAPVVLGARSAVFAPLENIGLVVVDEEHDWAYKQDDGLRYNGRDLARWRAAEAGAVLILGSATPCLESYQAALSGKLRLLTMKERPGSAHLPQVEIVDQGAQPARLREPLSPCLSQALAAALARGEQALLFINRRGLANLPLCLKCGELLKCPHCSRNLTLHGSDGPPAMEGDCARLEGGEVLICHLCGYRAVPPRSCPSCFSPLFRYFGVGTEKLLKLAEERFPAATAARLDTDSSRRKGGLKKILSSFRAGEIDILVGTQMAAKGHDFPNLTLVGVVDADMGLNLPDFRAAERTFQLLGQVAGRAGRAESPGTVLIQSLNPRHPVLTAVAAHDYEAFFASEIEARRELGFPPFSRLALIRFSGPDEAQVAAGAAEARRLAEEMAAGLGPGLELRGPMPSPLARLREMFRYQLLVRAASNELRHRFLSLWLEPVRAKLPKELRLVADIDPYHLL